MLSAKRISSLALGVLAIAVLAGCATSATTQEKDRITTKIGHFDKVNVVVSTRIDEANPSLGTVQEAIAKELQPRFAPNQVPVGKTEPGTLGVEIKIVQYEKHGFLPRLFLGGLLADRVGIEADLVDMGTHQKIGSFTGQGESRLGGIVVGDAGIYRASAALGSEINKYLSNN